MKPGRMSFPEQSTTLTSPKALGSKADARSARTMRPASMRTAPSGMMRRSASIVTTVPCVRSMRAMADPPEKADHSILERRSGEGHAFRRHELVFGRHAGKCPKVDEGRLRRAAAQKRSPRNRKGRRADRDGGPFPSTPALWRAMKDERRCASAEVRGRRQARSLTRLLTRVTPGRILRSIRPHSTNPLGGDPR